MKLLAGVFLGWSLGSNDAANVFGTAVSSQMVRWRTAAILIAASVMAGALIGGGPGLETLGGLGQQSMNSAFCVSLAAALTISAMTVARLPVSTSQAVVGAIIGIGIVRNTANVGGLGKVVVCWVGTPLGAAAVAFLLYPILASVIRAMRLHFMDYDRLMRLLLILSGTYAAYALGANNVANVTGVYYKAGVFGSSGFPAKTVALLVGGASIGLGALTFSRGVMLTVGRKIAPLDAFSAFVVIVSQAITVHVYAIIGVPVSTSQAVVGAVIGIGILKNVHTISVRTIAQIFLGWLTTPAMGLLLGLVLYLLVGRG